MKIFKIKLVAVALVLVLAAVGNAEAKGHHHHSSATGSSTSSTTTNNTVSLHNYYKTEQATIAKIVSRPSPSYLRDQHLAQTGQDQPGTKPSPSYIRDRYLAVTGQDQPPEPSDSGVYSGKGDLTPVYQ